MRLNFLFVLLVTLLLAAVTFSDAGAQDRRLFGSRRGYTVYAPDTAIDRIYNAQYDKDGYYHDRYGYYQYDWRWRPRRYHRRYREDRRYYDYYDRRGYSRRYYDRYDDDRYYYRGGGY